MKELSLINSTEVALVDDEDYDRITQWTWRLDTTKSGRRVLRVTSICGFTRRIKLANQVMQKYDVTFDHKDCNVLNNTKNNLRSATIQQNNCNKPKTSLPTTSQYKGVSWHKASLKWMAKVNWFGQPYYLGLFKDEQEAARAYDLKAKELHGEFANLNFK